MRAAALLLAGGTAPFVVGRAMAATGGDAEAGPVLCPFRHVTDLPCPLCGGTRAVMHAGSGDGAFLDYGAVWVLVLAAAAVAGAVALVLASAGLQPRAAATRAARTHPRVKWIVLGAVVAAAWGWALANRATIVGPGA